MEKFWKLISPINCFAFVTWLMLGLISWQIYAARPSLVDSSKFNRDSGTISKDLQYRYVAVTPQQLWGFSADQNVTIKVLQVKSSEDGVIVTVRMSSNALVGGKEAKDKPVSVDLDGIAKMHYELVAGEWHLADITSLTLKATQR
jgi:hypothetical protein